MTDTATTTPEDLRLALDRAKRAVEGGAELARRLSAISGKRITGQAISQWNKVPAERVVDVARATGIPREHLRPDIYHGAASDGAGADL